MQSVKNFLDYGKDNQYQRMHREALIYQLINMYDTGYTNEDGVEFGKMTIGAKRRLRNQVFADAKKVEKIAIANGENVSVNDVDVIVNSFMAVASKVSNFDGNLDKISADWSQADSPVRVETLNTIQSWDNSGTIIISPYDPLFSKSDAFSDINDGIGYVQVGAITDDSMISHVRVSDRFEIEPVANLSSIQNLAQLEMEGPLVRSGFSDISHYVKKADYDDVYKFLMNQQVRDITADERDFMRQICEMMSEQGVDFSITTEGTDKLRLKMPGGSEIRLLDLKEPQYNGRIYDNGVHAHLGLSFNGQDKNLVNAYINNSDRLNMIKWYFGVNDGTPLLVQEEGSHMIANNRKLGVQEVYYNATPAYKSSKALPHATSVAATTGRTKDNSILFKAINYGKADANSVKMILSSSTSSRFDSAEVKFSKLIKSFSTDNIRNNNGLWELFKHDIPETMLPLSDRNEDGSIKDNVDDVNFDYYQHLPAYLTLNEWVESSKNRHRELMNFETLVDDLEKYEVDETYEPDSSGDEDVDELRNLYWRMITGQLKAADIAQRVDGLDVALLESNNISDKLQFIETHYSNYLHNEFGKLPTLQIPGETPVDNTDAGFNPEKVAKYTIAEGSFGTQKNYDYIRHMLSRMGEYYSSDWIKGDTYIGNQIKNDLIKYDSNAELGSFKFNSVLNAYDDMYADSFARITRSNPDLANKPVTVEMMLHAGDTLLKSGFDKDSIELSVDENGIIKYTGVQKTTAALSDSNFTRDARGNRVYNGDSITKTGYIGQIFEPDEFGVIDPSYVVDTGLVFVPGYNVYLKANDPENPEPMRERLRGIGWKKQMKQQISKELHRAAFQISAEYDFTPNTAALNTVYRHVYDTTMSREDYQEHIESLRTNNTPEDNTFRNILKDLSGRCRFPNDYGEGASTMTQSMLEHPDREESKSYDFFYSDLYDNRNIRVMDDSFDGIFDPNATGTAKTQGVVRYLADGASFDNNTGKPMAVEFGPGEPVPECALMKDDLFRNKDHNTWDRRLMAYSQILTAWHTPRNVGVSMMNMKGLTFDDGFVVSKSFAELYGVKDVDGNPRPLVAQDKLSDMNGNKGVISFVVDPELISDNIASHLENDYDFNGVTAGHVIELEYEGESHQISFDENSEDSLYLQAAYQIQKNLGVYGFDDVMKVFRDNENLDVVMAPYSGMSRFNGGSMVTVLEESEKSKTLILDGKEIEGGIGYTDLIVVDMLADVKTHFYTEDAIKEGKGRKASGQLAWALQSKGANAIMREFYGNNGKAFDDLREYALAVGLDFDEQFTPVVGYHPQADRNEKRHLIKLAETDSNKLNYLKSKDYYNFADSDYNEITDSIMRQLNASGGFMELPFQLDFKTADGVSGIIGKNQIPEDAFLLQKTGQTYVDNAGKTHDTFGLPVLSQSLRSGQEFQDGTSRVHDYTQKYVEIYRSALLYKSIQDDAAYSKEHLDEAKSKLAELNAMSADQKANLVYMGKRAGKDGVLPEYKGAEAFKRFKKEYETDVDTWSKRFDKASNPATLQECVNNAQNRLDEITSDIIEHKFNSKYNVIREEVMSKRLSNSATAVWSADPRLKSDEVSLSMENAGILGLTETDENGVVSLKKDASVLLWRDPVLHDGNVRYMRVVIDNRLKGCAINPLMDASFDGDFDGDSVALVALQTDAAKKQAFSAFSFETNLLNKGVKQTIVHPETGEEIIGHPLYIQKGLDTAAMMYDNAEWKTRRAEIEFNVNSMENTYAKILSGELPEEALKTTIKKKNKETNRYDTVEIYGKSAANTLRRQYKREIDNWMDCVLDGIGQDMIRTDTPEHLVASLQHIVDDGAKGSQSKMHDLCNNIGVEYEIAEDGRAIAETAKFILDENGRIVSIDTLNGCQRQTDNAIQETAAYKADNTQLGGMAAQRGVAAFRDIDIHAALEITYPVTQAILQSKHDPKDAKIKDEIVRFWGSDCWDGYKLTGDWSDSATLESLQNSPHVRETRLVRNPSTGEPIPVQVCDADGNWSDKVDKQGQVVYEREYVKCTRDEWVQQMKGMMRALKVDDSINTDYIECLADAMSQEGSYAQAVSIDTGRAITYSENKSRKPIRTGTKDTVLGVTDFIKQKGTLLDQMGYIGKFGACVNKALLNTPAYRENMQAKGQGYMLEGRSVSSVIGNAVSECINIKASESKVIDARVTVIEAPKSEKDVAKKALRNAEQLQKDANACLSNSAMFVSTNVMNEIYGDIQRKETGSDINTSRAIKKGQVVSCESAPKPVGRKDCLLTVDSYNAGVAYMGESQTSYKARVDRAFQVIANKEAEMQTNRAQVRAEAAADALGVDEMSEVQDVCLEA